MKLQALFALVACVAGAATYFGVAGFGDGGGGQVPAAAAATDRTPTAAQFARRLAGAASDGSIADVHCVKGSPAHYMCAYAVVKPSGHECHLMQGVWTPGDASTITVTLAGRAGRCDSVRAAIQSLG